MVKAILFDVDGTLAETEEVHRRAFNETFAEEGLDWRWSRHLYGKLLAVTGGKERMRHFMDAYAPDERLSLDKIAALHKKKTARYVELIGSGEIELRPGVFNLIHEAREAGLKLAIVTTTSLPNVTALVGGTLGPAAMKMFDVVAAGDIVPAKKPAPDIYLKALDDLKLPASECLAIEDSENGLKAALAAGVPTVVTVSAYTDGQDFSGALTVLNSLDGVGLDWVKGRLAA